MATDCVAVKKTSSGIVTSTPAILEALLVGTDAVNDPTVTVYNGTDGTGGEVVPTTTYDASALGLNGLTGARITCENGIYLGISIGAGAVEVVVVWRRLRE